jgi:signal peptidase I
MSSFLCWLRNLFVRWRLSRQLRRIGSSFRGIWDRLSEEETDRISKDLETLNRRVRCVGADTNTVQIEASLVALEKQTVRINKEGRLGAIIEAIMIVLVVTLGVRTFFFHPMSIPTGSMEPTFMGEQSTVLSDSEILNSPEVFRALCSRLILGKQSIHFRASESGVFEVLDPIPRSFLWIFKQQRFSIDGEVHKIWFPPKNLWARAGLKSGMIFSEGEDVIRLRFKSGDHILVNRWVYNFRRPRRGEAVVLATDQIDLIPLSPFYLKRLVGFGEESVRIGDDRLVRIDDESIDSSILGFEHVAKSNGVPAEGSYSGYLNGTVARSYRLVDSAPLFPTEEGTLTVRAGNVFVLGDNSANSLDSRTWGDFSQKAIIGRPSFVFWPFSKRFGFADY